MRAASSSLIPRFNQFIIAKEPQYQFCLQEKNCTALNYLVHNVTQLGFPNASSLQSAVLQLLLDASYHFNILTSLHAAADKLIQVGGFVPSLPDDQWIKELMHWESHAYSSLQIAVEKYTTGAKSIDPYAESYIRKPQTAGEKALCSKQRVRKSGGVV